MADMTHQRHIQATRRESPEFELPIDGTNHKEIVRRIDRNRPNPRGVSGDRLIIVSLSVLLRRGKNRLNVLACAPGGCE
jgi:hypothetical protein